MFKTITTIMATGLLALGSAASADDSQPPSDPFSRVQQSAGGFGATTMWAYVAANGTHVSKTGGLALANTAKLNTGQYEVIFRRGVANNCMFTGTIGSRGLGASPGFIDVVKRGGNTKGVYVETRNAAGTLTDNSFIIHVTCYQ